MSTKTSLIFKEVNTFNFLHIYEDMLDGLVHIEYEDTRNNNHIIFNFPLSEELSKVIIKESII